MRATGMGALIAACVVGWAGTAEATPPTCIFSDGTLTVAVDIDAATLTAASTGAIRLNGATCVGATTSTTDTILVNGGFGGDRVTLVGSFAPGATAEADGSSEIEIVFELSLGGDTVVLAYTDSSDRVVFTSGGIDVGEDGDEDISTYGPVTNVETVQVKAKGGNDRVDGSLYTAAGSRLFIWGGAGSDILIGGGGKDKLRGESGPDVLRGGPGNDGLWGGPGKDVVHGDAGADHLYADSTVDGDDTFDGGDGKDLLDYSERTAGVTVTIGNGLADDGEPGVEFDLVDISVEHLDGGGGDDVLVGTTANNTLRGGQGSDELYGGGGNDTLYGDGIPGGVSMLDGGDLLVGDAGDDWMAAGYGDDTLEGGEGNDTLYGEVGNDFLDGGAGRDSFSGWEGNDTFINDDGIAETVDCGNCNGDDPQPSANDTFIACELI